MTSSIDKNPSQEELNTLISYYQSQNYGEAERLALILKRNFSSPLKLKIKGIKTIIPPAGDGIPSKKLSFHDGSSSELTLNLASLKATQTT